MASREIQVGIISDTHGLLRPEAIARLRGADLIIHAGDIGAPGIIDALGALAPTFAVRGNIDVWAWAARYPLTACVEAGEARLWVLHEIAALDLDPAAAGFAAVVYGHSHKPSIETRAGVVYINPGSAGPRRFSLPATMARARVRGPHLEAQIVHLGA
ncbi:MAG TPA: metallophosphoesterase family protein [Hyphomicrobiaceae bacterium]|nr:metallophosphoesterase family protein [Hyphomicrobiaceae bacterium]